MFSSIQGEGVRMGQPCTFIRFHGCNLECPWCDTKYALDGKYDETSISNIYNIIKELPVPSSVVCLTGGEPMIQNRGELEILCRRLKWGGFDVHVETNGLIVPSKMLLLLVDLWTISPKINEYAELYSAVKDSFCSKVRDDGSINIQVKFVVKNEDDVLQIKEWLGDWKPLVVVQPERYTFSKCRGVSFGLPRDMYIQGLKEIIPWCEKHLEGLDWRLLPQLHFLIWGDKRGV